jgi:site-specific DNA recombinase
LKDNGVKVISVREKIDGSPESILMESLIEGLAEYYSANLAVETMKGLNTIARKCKHTGGWSPFGYNVDPVTKSYILNDHEAIAVRYIFEQYAKGKSYSQIVGWLNLHGYKTKKGDAFKEAAIYTILNNKKYTGVYTYNGMEIPGGMPRIVDDQTFFEVARILRTNKYAGHKAKDVYLLTGILICGNCGRGMVGESKWNGKRTVFNRYYMCPGIRKKTCDMPSIKVETIEEEVLSHFDKFIKPAIPKYARMMHDAITQQQQDNTGMETVLKEIQNVDKQIGNIMDAIAEGMYHPSMKVKMTDLEERKKRLQFQVTEMKLEQARGDFDFAKIEAYLQSFANFLQNEKEKIKKSLRIFYSTIKINKDRTIEIGPVVDNTSCGGAHMVLSTTFFRENKKPLHCPGNQPEQ